MMTITINIEQSTTHPSLRFANLGDWGFEFEQGKLCEKLKAIPCLNFMQRLRIQLANLSYAK